jgi:phosphate-selective porin OprO/OprP
MTDRPRAKAYYVGRLTILIAGAAVILCSTVASAQDAPPVPEPVPPPSPPAAETPPPPPGPSALERRIDEIDQRARIAERKLELAEEAAAARRKETPVLTADDSGFGITSADGQYQIRLRGQLQLDGRLFRGDPTLADKDTFVARRIRPTLSGTLLGFTDFIFTPDFGNNTVAIVDAYVDLHPRPWLRLRVGKFKPPLGLERLQSDTDLVFIERALDSNLTAQREIGIQLWGDIAGGVLRYEGGVYNGVPDGTLLDVDTNEGKTLGGRVFIQPFAVDPLRGLGRLAVGVAASTGNEKGSPAAGGNPWVPSFRSAGQNTIDSYAASTTDPNGVVFALGRHTRVNPQLYYYVGPLGLLAEWVHENQHLGLGAGNAVLNNSGGHATLSYVIGGDETYEGPRPRQPASLAAGSLGALEIGARYNWFHFDSIAFPNVADPTKSVTDAKGFALALNWVPSRNIKVLGDYEQTSFTGGAKTGNRPTEKLVAGRIQVAF